MSTTNYQDSRISLNDILLMQFEQGRELPALLASVARKPGSLTIQDRTLMLRMIGALAGRRGEPTTLAVGIESFAVMAPIIMFIFGNQRKCPAMFFDPTPYCLDSPMTKDLIGLLKPENLISGARELLQRCAKGKDFLIVTLDQSDKNEIRSVIDMFTDGRKGLLLVKDYGHVEAASHYEYARERGFRLLELPDGSGELISL